MADEEIKDKELEKQTTEPDGIIGLSFRDRAKSFHDFVKRQPGGITSLYKRVIDRINQANEELPEEERIKMPASATFDNMLRYIYTPGKTIYDNLNILIFACEESKYPIESLFRSEISSPDKRWMDGFKAGEASVRAEQKKDAKSRKAERIRLADLEKLNSTINIYLYIIKICETLFRSGNPHPQDAYQALFFNYTRTLTKDFKHGEGQKELKNVDNIINFYLTLVNENGDSLPGNFNKYNIRALLISAYLYMAVSGLMKIFSREILAKIEDPFWSDQLKIQYSMKSDSPKQEEDLSNLLSETDNRLGKLCRTKTLEAIAYNTLDTSQKYMPTINSFIENCLRFSRKAFQSTSSNQKAEFGHLRNLLHKPGITQQTISVIIDDNLLELAENMAGALNEALETIKPMLTGQDDISSLPDYSPDQPMRDDTAALLKEFDSIPFTPDENKGLFLKEAKEAAEELKSEAWQIVDFMNSRGLGIQMPDFNSLTDMNEDLSALTYIYNNNTEQMDGQELFVGWHNNAAHISTSGKDFWFGPTFRQAKKDGIMIWFDRDLKMIYAKRDDGLEFEVSYSYGENINFKRPDGQEEWYKAAQSPDGLIYYQLSKQVKPDGTARFFEYHSNGLVSAITDEDNQVWQFKYNQDNELVQVIEPGRIIINNPKRALLIKEQMAKPADEQAPDAASEQISLQQAQVSPDEPLRPLLDAEHHPPETSDDTNLLLDKLYYFHFTVDDRTAKNIKKMKSTAKALCTATADLIGFLKVLKASQYDPAAGAVTGEDLSVLAYGGIEIVKYKDTELHVSNSGNIVQVSDAKKDLWFESTSQGLVLRQGKKDNIMVWFKEEQKMTHATIDLLNVWFNDTGDLSHFSYGQTSFWHGNDGVLSKIDNPEGMTYEFSYLPNGLLDKIRQTAAPEGTVKEWEFKYNYTNNTLSQIIEPDGKIISIPKEIYDVDPKKPEPKDDLTTFKHIMSDQKMSPEEYTEKFTEWSNRNTQKLDSNLKNKGIIIEHPKDSPET